MTGPSRHLTRCFVAGIVALLPFGGTVLGILWLETTLSESWRAHVPFYFPGLGLLAALVAIYLTGLFVTSFFGRWLWRRVDRWLENLPLGGTLYQSLKEVLGYDSSRDRFFEAVVAVRLGESDAAGFEIGLVTGRAPGPDGTEHTVVFVPSSPNPTNGRLLLLPPDRVRRLDLRAADALRGLVSMGKTPLGRARP